MRKLSLCILTYIIGVLVFQCNSNKERSKDTSLIKKFYYPNGNLKKVQGYKNDSIEHGVYLFYYPNEQLKDSGQFIDRRLRYLLKFDEHSKLSSYNACNYSGSIAFTAKYDMTGRILEYEGFPIYNFYPNIDSGVIFIQFLVANPVNHKTNLRVIQWSDTNPNDRLDNIFLPDSLCRINYRGNVNSKTKTTLLNILTISDFRNKAIITDTLKVEIDSKGNIHKEHNRPIPLSKGLSSFPAESPGSRE